MTFVIEDTDDDVDYSPTPLRDEDRVLPAQLPPSDSNLPDDNSSANEKEGLLGDRVIGTLGFCGALALLASSCCCCFRGCHKAEIASTYNRHTLFGLCCPLRW